MRFLSIEVRQDWKEFNQRISAESTRLWRNAQFLVSLSVIALILVTFFAPHWPWGIVLKYSLSSVLFVTFSFWTVFRSNPKPIQTILVIFLLLAGAAIVAGFSAKPIPIGLPEGSRALLPLPVQILIAAPLWGIIIWSLRRYPSQVKTIGLTMDGWPVSVVLGSLTALCLGGHFLLSTRLFARPLILPAPDFEVLFWVFWVSIGLTSVAEEILLRGVCFFCLFEESHSSFLKASAQIAVLNVLIYLAPVFLNPGTPWWLWVILYRMAFSFAATYLRLRQGSLVPGIVANVIFSTLLALVVRW